MVEMVWDGGWILFDAVERFLFELDGSEELVAL
jgi:hypothetical protein